MQRTAADSSRISRTDIGIAVAVLAVCEQEPWISLGSGFGDRVGPRLVMALAVAVMSASLLARRSRPMLVAVLVSAVLIGYYLGYGAPDGLVTLVPSVTALYACGRYGSLRDLVVGLAVTTLTLAVHTWRDPQPALPAGPTTLFWVAVLGSGLLGRVLAHRSEAIGALSRRAERLEHARAEQALEAVDAERRRIAAELHDLVGHGISLMVLQVEGAQAALQNSDPTSVALRLDRLSDTARRTMTEMRRLLSVVDDVTSPPHPQPGIADVRLLVQRMKTEGMPVDLVVDLAEDDLPGSTAIAAHRIVLEALTNVIKHAGPGTPAVVTLRCTGQALTVEVVNSGQTVADDVIAGRGLAGMRERVNLFGGDLRFGPCPTGGFALRATLPLDGRAL